MENDFYDTHSDASSDKTIIIDSDIIDKAIQNNNPSTSKEPTKNFYSLDEFDDFEISEEPLIKRIRGPDKDSALTSNKPPKSWQRDEISTNKVSPINNFSSRESWQREDSWQAKFTTDDFCEDSNDFDAVLRRINQLESEQFADKPKSQELSKEVKSLIGGSGNLNHGDHSSDKSGDKKGSEEELELNWVNLQSEMDKIRNNIKLDMKLLNGSDESLLEENSEPLVPVKKNTRKKSAMDKENEKLEKERAKAAKVKQREQKRLEKENEKQLKSALRVIENSIKPDHCMQYIMVNIDDNIAQKPYAEAIKVALQNAGYNYRVSKEIVPNVISWTRRVPTLENMLLQKVEQLEKKFLLLMDTSEFINHVANNTLIGHIQSLIHMPQIEHLSVGILGLQRYYKFLKDEKNRDFKAAVAETDPNKNKLSKEFKDLPHVSKKEIEKTLVELQIFCKNIYIRPLEKYEDLAIFVGECSKSVAFIPYKLSKTESFQQENEFFSVNNKDCVKVDNHGNGLGRLWNQFLRMFPLATLETAEAITTVYPTIHALIQAYKECDCPEDGEKLLQELPVRRAAGPLGGQRRLGPELSKKVYKFFYSTENILL